MDLPEDQLRVALQVTYAISRVGRLGCTRLTKHWLPLCHCGPGLAVEPRRQARKQGLLVETTGRHEHWLDNDPAVLRSLAVAPLATSLSLRPVHHEERAGTPQHVEVTSCILPDKTP